MKVDLAYSLDRKYFKKSRLKASSFFKSEKLLWFLLVTSQVFSKSFPVPESQQAKARKQVRK